MLLVFITQAVLCSFRLFDLEFNYSLTFICFECEGDSKPNSIIYPPRVVPKVEPNTNDVQARNIWGQPSSAPPQQRISHAPPHCKISIIILCF